jgi:transposase-like protein
MMLERGVFVDRAGDTVDLLLTANRDLAAARRCPARAINLHDVPDKITTDKRGADTAAIESVKAVACVDSLMRQCEYVNNIVEQDHRAIKRITSRYAASSRFRVHESPSPESKPCT